MRYLPLALAIGLLTGCATEPSNPRPAVCPPLAEYAPEDQTRLAAEIDAAPGSAIWPDFIADYGALRAAIRACKGD